MNSPPLRVGVAQLPEQLGEDLGHPGIDGLPQPRLRSEVMHNQRRRHTGVRRDVPDRNSGPAAFRGQSHRTFPDRRQAGQINRTHVQMTAQMCS
jgi:hypothetical protein